MISFLDRRKTSGMFSFRLGHQARPSVLLPAGYTLTELLVALGIISVLASLSLTGLAAARQRAKLSRTESTIRKIHEVVLPHFERILTRSVPIPPSPPDSANAAANALRTKCMNLLAKRRILALELPDGWNDLRKSAGSSMGPDELRYGQNSDTAISARLKAIARDPDLGLADLENSDAECLWAAVMQAGVGDSAIVSHFREDEFGDKNGNQRFEFLDGWSNPIRFLRWAPAFVSKYQPAASDSSVSLDTRSHDSFDLAGVDPLARNTLYPLIYSMGPDGVSAIRYRQNEADSPEFCYAAVTYDPYFAFATRQGSHFTFTIEPLKTAPEWTYSLNGVPASYKQPSHIFGSPIAGTTNDDITNHAMSR